MAENAPTITAAKLSQLTGFTDAELSKLAPKYFPKAVKGQYDQNLAIIGCFKARKDQVEAAGNLPTYESMDQCVSRSGVPKSVIKAAKKAGCEAFAGHRIRLAQLLRWIFNQKQDDAIDWGNRSKRADALIKEHSLEQKRERTLDKQQVQFAIAKAMATLFAAMNRRSEVELPADLKGLPETEIQKRLLASDEMLKENVRKEIGMLLGGPNDRQTS